MNVFFFLFFRLFFLFPPFSSFFASRKKDVKKKREGSLFFLVVSYFPKDAMYITNLVGLLLIQQRSQKGFVLLLLSI